MGMTRADFEERWLTLGTESKVGANERTSEAWTGPRNAPVRPITGEKGIGRLAIAAIGPQVLVMTRAVRPDGHHPLVASLLHWGLFELPGIDLDSIDIPIEEVASGSLPDAEVMKRLTSRVRDKAVATAGCAFSLSTLFIGPLRGHANFTCNGALVSCAAQIQYFRLKP